MFKKDQSKAGKSVIKRYKSQKTRGQEGFGYILISNGKITAYNRAANENDILPKLQEEAGEHIIFHHRMPTSTVNIAEAAHPIIVKSQELLGDKVLYVVHNGIISNAQELKTKHEALKYRYETEIKTEYVTKGATYTGSSSFNDSEAFAVDLALYLCGKQDKLESKGSIAFVAVEATTGGEVIAYHYGRNYQNPLMLDDTKQYMALTSEGQGKIVAANVIYSMDTKLQTIKERAITIGSEFMADPYYDKYFFPNKTTGTKSTYNDDGDLLDMYEEDYLEAKESEKLAEKTGDSEAAIYWQEKADEIAQDMAMHGYDPRQFQF